MAVFHSWHADYYNYRQSLPGASNDGTTCAHRPASKQCWWIQEDCFSIPPRRHKTITHLVSRHTKNTFWQNGSYSKSLVANVHHLFVLRNGFPNLCRWFCMCHFFQISDRPLCKQIRPWTDKAEWQCSEKNACVGSPKSWHALCERLSPVWTNMSFNVFQLQFFSIWGGFTGTLKECVTHRGPKLLFFFSEQL